MRVIIEGYRLVMARNIDHSGLGPIIDVYDPGTPLSRLDPCAILYLPDMSRHQLAMRAGPPKGRNSPHPDRALKCKDCL